MRNADAHFESDADIIRVHIGNADYDLSPKDADYLQFAIETELQERGQWQAAIRAHRINAAKRRMPV